MNVNIVIIVIIGLFTGVIGMGIGLLFSRLTTRIGFRLKKLLLCIISGIMLSVVCFDLIPEAIEESNLYIAAIGLIIGVLLSNILENILEEKIELTLRTGNDRLYKAAVMMAIGIGIHNIPGGIAIGSLLHKSILEGIGLALILILHGIPESMAVGIFLKESNLRGKSYIWILLLTSLTMALGALIGGAAGNISPIIISISLSIAASMILYIIFRETIPEAIEQIEAKHSATFIILGITIGIFITSLVHISKLH